MQNYYLVMVDAGHDVWFPFRVKAQLESSAIEKVVKYAIKEKQINAKKIICYPIYRNFNYEVCEVPEDFDR